MSTELRRALEQVAARSRGVRLWGALALCWLAFALIGCGLSLVLGRARHRDATRSACSSAGSGALAASASRSPPRSSGRAFDPRRVARQDRGEVPRAGHRPAGRRRGSRRLARRSAGLPPVRRDPPGPRPPPAARLGRGGGSLLEARARQARPTPLSLALLAMATVAMVVQGHRHNQDAAEAPRRRPGTARGRRRGQGRAGQRRDRARDLAPGRRPVQRRRPRRRQPRRRGRLGRVDRRPMARSLEDPTFAGRVESVGDRPHLSGPVRRPGPARPTRSRSSSTPRSAGPTRSSSSPTTPAIETKIVEDIRHVTAVEGTELTLTFRLNKEVAEAEARRREGGQSPRSPSSEAEDSHLYASTFTLADSHRYKVELVDKEGRPSKVPAEVAVNVTRNRPATVAMTQPAPRRPGLAGRGADPPGQGRRRLRRGPPRPELLDRGRGAEGGRAAPAPSPRARRSRPSTCWPSRR